MDTQKDMAANNTQLNEHTEIKAICCNCVYLLYKVTRCTACEYA